MRALAINVLVSAAALILALALAEWGVRAAGLWYFPPKQPDWYAPVRDIPGVPYLLKPGLRADWGQGGIHGNSMGLRDHREPGMAKTRTRILAIGDSLTFGFGVDQSQTYPRWLERLAADAGRDIEVINAGMNGFNLQDAAALLPALLDRYQPDAVVWFIISNDYDDSFSAHPDGTLTSSSQVASATTLIRWGYRWDGRVDAADFKNSMTADARAHLDPTFPAPKPGRLRNWLAQNSAIAALVEHVVRRAPAASTSGQLVYREDHASAKGPIAFVEHHAIFHSATHTERARRAITSAMNLTGERGVPLFLVNAGLPIPAELRKSSGRYHYADLTTLLRRPFNQLQQTHNLGWDPHLTSSGNRILAEAVLDGLHCGKVMPASLPVAGEGRPCSEIEAWRVLAEDYWRDYSQRHRAWAAGMATRIDFVRPAGVHQIVGGIGMDRMFPLSPTAQPAAILLLRPAGSTLVISGDGDATLRIGLRWGTAEQSVGVKLTAGQARIDISRLLEHDSSDGLLNVELSCERLCQPVRLKSIAAQAASAQEKS